MWRRIEIKNFRSIEKVCVDLAPFSVIVGPNGSGKSNFADALVFARDVANDASMAIQNRGGIASLRRWRPKGATDVSIDLRVAASRESLNSDYVRHQFTLKSGQEGEWRFQRESIQQFAKGAMVFDVERIGEKVRSTSVAPQFLAGPAMPGTIDATSSCMMYVRRMTPRLQPLSRVRRFRLNSDAMRQPQIATERATLDESGSNIAVVVQRLHRNQERWKLVLTAMAKIVPGLVDISVGVLGRYLVLRFLQSQAGEGSAEFAAADMSEGAIRALGILIAAEQMLKDELLIIEEPEVSIHAGAAQMLFEVLKAASYRGAVLLTTHSAELLDAARDEEILVSEYRGGITGVGSMATSQRDLVKQGLFTVAELLRSEPLRIEGSKQMVLDPISEAT
jgi:type I restriction enzyme M protein